MSTTTSPTGGPAGDRAPRRRRHRAAKATRALAVVVLVVGLIGSAVAAGLWSRAVERDRQSSLQRTTDAAATAVATRVARGDDLLDHLRGLVATWPDITNTELAEYWRTARIAEQFPGVLGYSTILRVPADEVEAFGAAQLDDPVTGLTPPDAFAVFPAGPRDEYCLQRTGVWTASEFDGFEVPVGFDFCVVDTGLGEESELPPVLDAATDTGRLATTTIAATPGLYTMVLPLYDTGTTPDTVEARRQASVGWASVSLDADALVDGTVGDSPGIGIVVRHDGQADDAVVVSTTSGRTPGDDAVTSTVDAGSGWTVAVTATPGDDGITATQRGLLVFAAGALLAFFAALVIWLLAGSRRRALELVDRRTDQLAYQALHDDLTGLPNRALLVDRAERMLARAARENTDVAAMFLDLDDFKGVNDTLGHGAGDQLLVAVANRFTATLRRSDTVGRLGGDEFVILVEGDSLLAGPEVVAERLLDVLREPFVLNGEPRRVAASIGIAAGPRDTVDDWLRDADIALYEAKSNGKNRYAVFASEMHDTVHSRVELAHDLAAALDDDQFFVVYQPTFDLRSNRTTGVEALLRWAHPTRGTVMPDEFIPAAETTGAIVPIGAWVLHEACTRAADWNRRGGPLSVSVNVSVHQLEHDGLLDDVRDALTDSGLDPALLILEITETTLMRDAAATQRRLRELKALGIRLAIDDFGTGYSSMGYLRQFPVDIIKIDRTFISGIADPGEASALMHTLVQLGKALGLGTLAEGIEEPAQLTQLLREHCDSGQGFLFARPLSPADLETFLGLPAVTPADSR